LRCISLYFEPKCTITYKRKQKIHPWFFRSINFFTTWQIITVGHDSWIINILNWIINETQHKKHQDTKTKTHHRENIVYVPWILFRFYTDGFIGDLRSIDRFVEFTQVNTKIKKLCTYKNHIWPKRKSE